MTPMNKEMFLNTIKHRLIVSCQALEDEPLHDPYIMARMAVAVKEGGSAAIRANSPEQIAAIKEAVDLPIIALYKKCYAGSPVYITPTMAEVDALMAIAPDVIALDATRQARPHGQSLEHFFAQVKEKYPNQLFMADTSCYEEGVLAQKLGFDMVSTTLSGYTAYTRQTSFPNYELMRRYCDSLHIPVIAEGGIWSPEQLKKAFETGVWAAVIGTAITRPREITRRFIELAGLK